MLLFLLLIPAPGYGYIDPGTGSYFIQIIIAVLAGGAFAIKIFWKKIIAFFKTRLIKKSHPDNQE